MAGYWNLISVLDDYTVAVHYPTVPPRGERAVVVVVVIAMAVLLLHHLNRSREHHCSRLPKNNHPVFMRSRALHKVIPKSKVQSSSQTRALGQ